LPGVDGAATPAQHVDKRPQRGMRFPN
jgi:hypothetical protein